MLYGLYISAAGVMANSHRQDVISNNLANSETVGFKRDLAMFMERPPESRSPQFPNPYSHQLLDKIGGGLLVAPTVTDQSAGELETTDNPLDLAIHGSGFLAVESGGKRFLTRDGRLMVDRKGNLIQSATGAYVQDADGKPIQLDPTIPATVGEDGSVVQDNQTLAKLGLFDVTDTTRVKKVGGNRMTILSNAALKPSTTSEVLSGRLERANVDPASELAALMETQRELEANANMIRYQDQSLGRLINEVGKIG
jgi:flagellar basal-body rod protein FlgF